MGCTVRPAAMRLEARCRAANAASSRASSASGSSGRRCWRSVGASVLRRSIARFVGRNEPFQVTPQARSRQGDAAAARASSASRSREQVADLLVRLDPRRRHARIAQHPKPECALPRRRVVLEREPLSLVRQLVERALVHRLADLSLDDALPRRTDRELALAVASLGHHARNRSGRVTGKLTRIARYRGGDVQTIDGRPVYSATDLVGYPRLRAPDAARARRAGGL